MTSKIMRAYQIKIEQELGEALGMSLLDQAVKWKSIAEAERARSAKLIEALQFFVEMSMTYKGQTIDDPRKQRAVDAIAEYEADNV